MTEQPVDAARSASPTLIAYVIAPPTGMELVAAPASRVWMDATRDRFANRCLPLRIANQAGWFITNDETVRAVWNGGDDPQDVHLGFEDESRPHRVESHFGHGIVTWRLPYLFRTPPRYNLLVRGPSNWPIHGAFALEGIVETDWAVATFTMNWQLTSVDTAVCFLEGEPIAMVVPQRRGELEEFVPSIVHVSAEPGLASRYHGWNSSREQFIGGLKVPGSTASAARWQRDYVLGKTPDGTVAPEHQARLNLRAPVRLTESFGSDHREEREMEPRLLSVDDIDVVNRVLRHYPAVAEVMNVVQALSRGAAYPIQAAEDLIERADIGEVVFRGRAYGKDDLLAIIPGHYFPIVSEDDLIAKIADLAAREEGGSSSVSREPAWGRQLDELPPGVERPNFSAIETPASPGVAHALGIGADLGTHDRPAAGPSQATAPINADVRRSPMESGQPKPDE